MGPLDTRVELHHSGAWHDITRDVNASDDIVITRGRQDWARRADPSTCTLLLNNTGGKYSPRNPRSPLFGLIGRNTPLRVRVGEHRTQARFQRDYSAYIETEDTAGALSPAGQFEVRIELEPDTWYPERERLIGGKGHNGNESWLLLQRPEGWLRLAIWLTDRNVCVFDAPRTSYGIRSKAFRAVYHPSGASWVPESDGHPTVVWYTADSLDGEWVFHYTVWNHSLIGADVYSSGDPAGVGALAGGDDAFDAQQFRGVVRGLQVVDSTGMAADVRLAGLDLDAPSTITDATGRVWTATDAVTWEDLSTRFAGEVSAWPSRWDVEDHPWVPIEASGIRRRLSQGSEPLRSVMYRTVMDESTAAPVAYWPLEDGSNATQFSSATSPSAMSIHLAPGESARDTRLAAWDGFDCSAALPEFHQGGAFGVVPSVPPTGELRLIWLMRLPEEGVATEVELATLRTTGTAREWTIMVRPDGRYRLVVRAWDAAILADSGWLHRYDESVYNGRRAIFSIRMVQNGSNIDYQKISVTQDDSISSWSYFTLSGHTLGAGDFVSLNASGDASGAVLGHVSLYNEGTDEIFDTLAWDVLAGWHGEQAMERMLRLSAEEDISLTVRGDVSERLGIQRVGTTLELLDGAAASDGGILTDSRDRIGLQYRARDTLYNQTPTTLDYSAGEIVAPFEPTDDDQNIVNDATVERIDGASHRVVETEGPLSIQPPPEGVGRYDTSVDLSLASDGQALHQAGWQVHLGTVDEARYPSITVDLLASPELVDRVLPLAAGDRVRVENLPSFLPPGGADVIVQGYTEVLNAFVWRITYTCVPASPWTVGVAEDEVLGRCDTLGSTLDAGFTSGVDTTMTVSTTAGPPWVTDPSEFPFDITVGGVVLTATGITGSGWVGPILDESFEAGVGDWSTTGGGTITHDTTIAHTGSASLRFDPDGTRSEVQVYYSAYDIPVTPGVAYDVEAWVWAASGSAGITEVRVNTYFNTTAGGGVATIYGHRTTLPAEVWQPRRMRITAPEGAEVIRVAVVASGESIDAAEAFWVDDITVTPALRAPQTVTVDQTPVNGISRTIPAGSDVRLAHPMIVSL